LSRRTLLLLLLIVLTGAAVWMRAVKENRSPDESSHGAAQLKTRSHTVPIYSVPPGQ
jgi:hypothetical protein